MKCFSFSTTAFAAMCAFVFTHTANADDLKAMEGKWKVEKAEAGGKEIESDDLKSLVVAITGNRYEVLLKDKMDAGTLKLDETQKPKTMDATDTEGDDVGKVIKAIYEISGDTLRVCYAADGGERPKEFATKEGVPVVMITYQREK
jgi:uncharacterized protein (TIGR03067 family)